MCQPRGGAALFLAKNNSGGSAATLELYGAPETPREQIRGCVRVNPGTRKKGRINPLPRRPQISFLDRADSSGCDAWLLRPDLRDRPLPRGQHRSWAGLSRPQNEVLPERQARKESGIAAPLSFFFGAATSRARRLSALTSTPSTQKSALLRPYTAVKLCPTRRSRLCGPANNRVNGSSACVINWPWP